MAKKSEVPAGYASQWHYEADLEARERDILGLQQRVSELEAMPAAHPDQIAAAKAAVEVAKAQLREVSGQKAAAKRPKKAAESR